MSTLATVYSQLDRNVSVWIAGQTPDSHRHEIYLDGLRLPLCIRAHAGQGWALVYRTDAEGQICHDCFDRPCTELLTGPVEIRSVND